ncbi:Tripartite motif-containing protein 66 [Phytophthora cinnamomi]|uniref:Tripartite motif-containing protein 66 n=1 Tax=Phytophthora cinnamomi TaxID=4785 RepID=UPI003559FDB9|nr:Tripartite motif-containing protein 66 [Phytophthora cinnamomi]
MESTRRYTKLPSVCRNTLRANVEGVTKALENNIGDEMPGNFGLLLDAWSHRTEHYLGVFACYDTPSTTPTAFSGSDCSRLFCPNADIVAAPDFEDGVVKVLGGRVKQLSWAEKAALRPFEREARAAADATKETTKVGFADRILKRRKVQDEASAYVWLNVIRPTSNAAERVFSMARMVLRYERNHLSPLMLDMLLFLKVNSKYWDVTTMDAVMN